MSVEELVKRLRHSDEYEPLGHDGWEAADKLEELAAETRHLGNDLSDNREYVSQLKAALAEAKRDNEALREALFVADAALMKSHGNFPLDRRTPDEVFLNDAATLIRSYTDVDYAKRHLVVDQWFARNAGGKNA